MNETTNLGIIGVGIRTIGDILLTIVAELLAKQNDNPDNIDNFYYNNFIDKTNNIINKYLKDIANIDINTDFSNFTLGDLGVIANALVLIGDLLLTVAALDQATISSDINTQVTVAILLGVFFSVIGDISALEAALLLNEK